MCLDLPRAPAASDAAAMQNPRRNPYNFGSFLFEQLMSYPLNHGKMAITLPDETLEREVAHLVVTTLNLDVSPELIDPDAPLYREGLGLDSIDILEIALVVSKRYGFQLRADNEDNVRIFGSLRSLSQHIAVNRVEC
jgi:acyl carrier protein